MNNKTALVFGFNNYAFEIAAQVTAEYEYLKIYSLDESDCEDEEYNIEHFDLSDDWSNIEDSIDANNSIAFCVLEDTAENIFLTISLRANFENLTIIAISSNKESANKLIMAGANKVIPLVETTADIITNMLEKPISNNILHSILYEESNLKIAQIRITCSTYFKDEQISDIDWSRYNGIVVLSVMHEDMSSEFIYSSKAKNHIIKTGDILVVVGYDNDIQEFKKLVGGEL